MDSTIFNNSNFISVSNIWDTQTIVKPKSEPNITSTQPKFNLIIEGSGFYMTLHINNYTGLPKMGRIGGDNPPHKGIVLPPSRPPPSEKNVVPDL